MAITVSDRDGSEAGFPLNLDCGGGTVGETGPRREGRHFVHDIIKYCF